MDLTSSELTLLNSIHDEDELARIELAITQKKDDLSKVLGMTEGRRFLWGVISDCEVYNPIETQLHEGRRRIGLELIEQIISVSPERWIEMQTENIKGR